MLRSTGSFNLKDGNKSVLGLVKSIATFNCQHLQLTFLLTDWFKICFTPNAWLSNNGTFLERKQIISLSASANKLSTIQKQAKEYAALIMEELDPEQHGYIMVNT